MDRWNHSGGRSKRRRTVENTPRIDSFEAGESGGWGTLFVCADGRIPLALDCCHHTGRAPGGAWETLEVWRRAAGWRQTLELARKRNGFGGSQVFFLCPACGRRARYLYLAGDVFLCRRCAGVTYKSQQETRSGCMYYYDKGVDFVRKHLEPPPFFIDGFGFNRWMPNRPRYMHQITYQHYLARFLRYREKHAERQMDEMLRLLKRFK